MPDIPKSVIDSMDYRTRLQHYDQEKEEYLRTTGSKPGYEYSEKLKELAKKWKV